MKKGERESDREQWVIRSYFRDDPDSTAWWCETVRGRGLDNARGNAVRFRSFDEAESEAQRLRNSRAINNYVVEEIVRPALKKSPGDTQAGGRP